MSKASYRSILWWLSVAKGAGYYDNQLLVLQLHGIVLVHAHHLVDNTQKDK